MDGAAPDAGNESKAEIIVNEERGFQWDHAEVVPQQPTVASSSTVLFDCRLPTVNCRQNRRQSTAD